MKIKKINIALWGFGNHSKKRVLTALLSNEYVDLVGVCSRNKINIKNSYGPKKLRIWSDYLEMLSCSDIDAVYICTPTALHYEHSKIALNYNKHIICEKPITDSYKKTCRLYNFARRKNLVIYEACMYTHHPQWRYLKDYVQSNKLGKIKQIDIKLGIPKLDFKSFRNVAKLGASSIWDLLYYPISALISLQLLPIHVIHKKIYYKNEIDHSGYLNLLIKKNINCNIAWGYDYSYQNKIFIWGNKTSIEVPYVFSKSPKNTSLILIHNNNGQMKNIKFEEYDYFIEMIDYFCFIIRNKKNKYSTLASRKTSWHLTQLYEK